MSELDKVVGSILASYETGPRSLHHIGGYELPQQTRSRSASRPHGPCSCRVSWALPSPAPAPTTFGLMCSKDCRITGNPAPPGVPGPSPSLQADDRPPRARLHPLRGGRRRDHLPLHGQHPRAARARWPTTSRRPTRATRPPRHRRDHLLLPGPLRDHRLPDRPRAASLGVPLIPRMMTEYRPRQDRHRHPPRRHDRPSFFIDHGTGVVIGENHGHRRAASRSTRA